MNKILMLFTLTLIALSCTTSKTNLGSFINLAEQKCTRNNDIQSCSQLNTILLSRLDTKSIRSLYQGKCSKNFPYACASLALAESIDFNYPLVMKYSEKGCEYGHTPSCQVATKFNRDAMESYTSCHDGSVDACTELAKANNSPQMLNHFLKIKKKICNKSTPNNCVIIGKLLESQEGLGSKKAIEILKDGCGMRSSMNCEYLAHHLARSNPKQALHYYKKSIKLDPSNTFAMNNLAWFYLNKDNKAFYSPRNSEMLCRKILKDRVNLDEDSYQTCAGAYSDLGNFKKALVLMTKSIEILKTSDTKNDTEKHQKIIKAYINKKSHASMGFYKDSYWE